MHAATATRSLDADQRVAVDLQADAEAVVIGAPGSGKTEALLARATRLLVDGALAADELLILTPSRQTATRLRDAIALRVGMATPGALARSFGSLAFQIVRAAMVLQGRPAPQLLTGADQDRIIAELLAGDDLDATTVNRWPEELPSAARASTAFRSELRGLIDECAELGMTPGDLARLGEQTGRPVWRAAGSFLETYRDVIARLRPDHRDASDLLVEATVLLRSSAPGVTGESQVGTVARLRTVLIDDAQELPQGMISFVHALRARGVAVVAFGDPDIGSGAFRGVTPELFAGFAGSLGRTIVLDGQYRADPEIQRLSRVVTQSIGTGGVAAHRRTPGPERTAERVRALIAGSPFEEADAIARTVREWRLLEEVPWSRIAVIAHDTRQVTALENELGAREVPVQAAGVQRPLGQERVVRDLLEIIRVAGEVPDDWDRDALEGALQSVYCGLDAIGLRRLRAALRHEELASGGNRGAGELVREAMAKPVILEMLDMHEGRRAARLAHTLARLRAARAEGQTIHELLWMVWDRARSDTRPLAEVWRERATRPGPFAAETARSLDALVALFEAAKRAVERGNGTDVDGFIHTILDSDVPEDTLAGPVRHDAITVMTPAGALGLEFDAVVVAGVQEGVWPNVRLRGGLLDGWALAGAVAEADASPAPSAIVDRRRLALHDELRLFLRAVSRASSRLLVTAVDDDDAGPSALFSFLPPPVHWDAAAAGHPLTLRGLVAEHRRTLTEHRATQGEREQAAGQLQTLAHAGVPGAAPEDWYGVLPASSDAPLRNPLDGPIPVSPSKLEAFEACGVDWAVRALGGDAGTWSKGLGTILHAVMEDVPSGDLAEMQRVVDGRWNELEFEAPWLSAKEQRWASTLLQRLGVYLDGFRRAGGERLGAEADFALAIPLDPTATITDVVVGEEHIDPARPYALLRGSIDRVEQFPAGAGEAVPQDDSRPAEPRVVVVDLKTGRSELRYLDGHVTEDAQLAAYQLAVLAGAVPGAAPERLAGARLLVLSATSKASPHWRIAHQPPLDATQADGFVQRVVGDAVGMASASFQARIDTHCSIDRFAVCTIHTVKPVSAS